MKKILIVQFISWTIFTLADFIEETFSFDLELIICLCAPIVIGVLYLKSRQNNEKDLSVRKHVAQTFIFIFDWSVITLCITIIITVLAINNTWIIHQSRIGLENMFNGIEYLIFGGFLLIIPIVIVFVGEVLILLFRKYRSYRKTHK